MILSTSKVFACMTVCASCQLSLGKTWPCCRYAFFSVWWVFLNSGQTITWAMLPPHVRPHARQGFSTLAVALPVWAIPFCTRRARKRDQLIPFRPMLRARSAGKQRCWTRVENRDGWVRISPYTQSNLPRRFPQPPLLECISTFAFVACESSPKMIGLPLEYFLNSI